VERMRKRYLPSFKAKVALEAIREQKTSGPDSELERGCPEGSGGSVQRQAKRRRIGQRETDCRALPPDRSAEG
jgi:hypothetical protein